MNSHFRQLRLRQLVRALTPFEGAVGSPRPARGWLRAVRDALGVTLREVGERLGATPQLIAQFESAEQSDTITLGSLKSVAEALDCQLVYAIVPKSGSILEQRERRARQQAREHVLAVEHSMALEGQAAGKVEEKIAEETDRLLGRSRRHL